MKLSKKELNLIREWYNVVSDLKPHYLKDKDQNLYCKILTKLIKLNK